MSLLEIITEASANKTQLSSESINPIILNSDPILLKLKPQIEDTKSLTKCEDQWQFSETDSEIIELGQKFLKSVKIKLKNPNNFGKNEFIRLFNSYFESCSEKIGISIGIDASDVDYTYKLIGNLGFLISRDVLGLVLEACVMLEIWELLKNLVVLGLVKNSSMSNLVYNLIQKGRSELVCLCVMHVQDLRSSDIFLVLKYFLAPSKETYGSMVSLRKVWEDDALAAIKLVKAGGKALNFAKEASILLMVAYDGFSASELCLHYLLSRQDLDEVMLSSCISNLNSSEVMAFIRYLGKWLRKYEKFPQAYACPKASSELGLKACTWVPPLANIVQCFGLVVDEHFSSLVLHSELHEELNSFQEVANSLSSEARFCSTAAKLVETLRLDFKDTD